MLILLILSLILLTAVLYAQYRRSRALRRAARDLKEARAAPGTRLRLYSPDDKLEELLSQINGLLEDKERETRILRSREESLRRQIANVSHDLRTPLTSILGYLQLMGREDVSPEEYRHCLEIVEGRAKVLQDLITSFYDLSRIEGGEYPLVLQAVDLRRALEPLLAGFYEDFEQAGFQVTVELSDWNGNTFIGTVTAINMGAAESQNGMTNYPVTLTVDNQDGSLLAGMYLDYSFVASQSDDCMMVPMQSVKNIPSEDGMSTDYVVFIRADERPENAVDLEIPEPEPGESPAYPSPQDGFYPVKVETGLNDNYNVEIKSGLRGDEEVFVNYLVESAYG